MCRRAGTTTAAGGSIGSGGISILPLGATAGVAGTGAGEAAAEEHLLIAMRRKPPTTAPTTPKTRPIVALWMSRTSSQLWTIRSR